MKPIITRKQFETLWNDNKIKTENRLIESVSVTGFNNSEFSITLCITIGPKRSLYYCSNEINVPIERIKDLAKILHDDSNVMATRWDSSCFAGKYIRLCFYETPDEDMHELADKYQLVALKHIINDDEKMTMFL